MDCNKDEAIRAMEIATKKFSDKDYAGAKKLALKAQSLHPSLEGIAQMIMNLDVHISAQRKLHGEMDWYTILGVHPIADVATIKKQYKKSALFYHPDKNRSVGAESAFQIVAQGFSVLLDDAQRSAYDRKVNMQHAVQPNAQCQRKSVPMGPTADYRTGSTNVSQGVSKPQQRVPNQTRPSYGMPTYRHPQQPGSTRVEPFDAPPGSSSWEHIQVMRRAEARARSSSLGGAHQRPPREPTGSASVPPHGAMNSQRRPQNEQRPSSSSQGTNRQSRGRAQVQGENLGGRHKNEMPRQNVNQPKGCCSNGKNPATTLNPQSHRKASTQGQGPGAPQGSSKAKHNNWMDHVTDCFWTRCKGCRIYLEYPKLFLNQFLLCFECQTGFEAVEVKPPSSLAKRVIPCPRNQAQGASLIKNMANRRPSYGKTTSIDDMTDAFYSYMAAQTTHVGQPIKEKAKREREEGNIDGGSEKKQKQSDQHLVKSPGVEVASNTNKLEKTEGRNASELAGKKEKPPLKATGSFSKPNTVKVFSQINMQKLLTEKAITVVTYKLNKSHAVDNQGESLSSQKGAQAANISTFSPLVASPRKDGYTVAMTVPDSDFHNFDEFRSGRCFRKGEVWAVYDNDDGMPRFYALIHKVISLQPFKLEISWLDSKSNSEFSSLEWVSQGFTKTCGNFVVGKHVLSDSENSLSHRVECSRSRWGVVQIYPSKGEIWALYRNWSSSWTIETPEEARHAYNMVEVLDGFKEEQGVLVAPLLKVSGFRSIFSRTNDPKDVQRIPKEEMFRFSHQVPSVTLTGQEAAGVCEGYFELDTAAIPAELVQAVEVGGKGGEGKGSLPDHQ